jgi:phosphatidylglycerophosphate synthase
VRKDLSKLGIADMNAAYDAGSRLNDKQMDFLGYYVYRPLSFPMTIPFLRAGLSANQVTWFRIGVVLVALALLGVGGYAARMTAAALLVAHLFLDLIDGNIARLAGPSAFGGFLDEITDILLKVFTPVALALGLFLAPDRILTSSLSALPNWMVLIAGLVTAVSSCVKAYVNAELRRQVGREATGSASEGELDVALKMRPKLGIGYCYRTGVSLLILAIPVFAWFDALSIYLAIVLLTRTLTMPVELISAVYGARKKLD